MTFAVPVGRTETTRAVTRGARRLLRACGFSVIGELPLPNGGRADLVALSSDGRLRIVEVKSGQADFRADHKWTRYADYCDHLYFAVPPEFDSIDLPDAAGLIVADSHSGMILRQAPRLRVAPASRRAMLLRFAMHAAERYSALAHPEEGGASGAIL